MFGDSEARSVTVMQEKANEALDTLLKNTSYPWIDCARSYGYSEQFVGEYLKQRNIKPDSVYVSSKWGYSEYQTMNGYNCRASQKR